MANYGKTQETGNLMTGESTKMSLPNGPVVGQEILDRPKTPPVDPTTVRHQTHGAFGDNATFANQARDLMRSMNPGWSNCTAEQCLALDEIMLKIARILSGGNRVSDHWIDIAGYAKLGDIPEVDK